MLHCILIFFAINGIGQDDNSQYVEVQYLGVDQGLTNNEQWSQNAILYDQDGFTWILSLKGLNRYDGTAIKQYTIHDDYHQRLTNGELTAIAQDDDGIIWLGTNTEGLIKFDPSTSVFESYQTKLVTIDGSELKQINALIFKDDQLYIGTAFNGLHRYNLKTKEIYTYDFGDRYKSGIGTTQFIISSKNELIINHLYGIIVETRDGSYEHYNIFSNYQQKRPQTVIELSDGSLLMPIYGEAEWCKINRGTGEIMFLDMPSSSNTIQNDHKGNIWIGSHEGTFVCHESTLNQWTNIKAIDGDFDDFSLICMMLKADGTMTFNSLHKGAGTFSTKPLGYKLIEGNYLQTRTLNRTQFFSNEHSIYKRVIDEGYQLVNQQALVGPIHNFAQFDNGDFLINHGNKPTLISLLDMHGQRKASSWLSRIYATMIPTSGGKMFVDSKDVLLGAEDIPYEFVAKQYEKELGVDYPDYKVNHFCLTQKGDLLLATFNDGVLQIESDKKEYNYLPIDDYGNGKLNSNNATFIFEDSKQNLLIMTDRGLNIRRKGSKTFEYLSHQDGLKDNNIIAINEDNDGNIWMLFQKELFSFHLDKLQLKKFKINKPFRIASSEIAELSKDRKGNFYFSCDNGIASFNPKELLNQKEPDNIIFTELYINKKLEKLANESSILTKAIHLQSSIDLEYEQRDLGLSFSCPDGHALDVSYYYMLEGYDKTWKTTKDPVIHYTNLQADNYQFHVKALSAAGIWTKDVSSLEINVSAPWYKTWNMYVIYLICFLGLIYAIYYYQMNQILKYQKLRTQISDNLHDHVGNLLSGIAMQSELLAMDMEENKAQQMSVISTLSKEAMTRIKDVSWAVDYKKDTFKELVIKMDNYLNEVCVTQNKKGFFDTQNIQENNTIPPNIRQHIFLIYKTVIDQLLERSNGKTLMTFLGKNKSKGELVIKDEGTNGIEIRQVLLNNNQLLKSLKALDTSIQIELEKGIRISIKVDF